MAGGSSLLPSFPFSPAFVLYPQIKLPSGSSSSSSASAGGLLYVAEALPQPAWSCCCMARPTSLFLCAFHLLDYLLPCKDLLPRPVHLVLSFLCYSFFPTLLSLLLPATLPSLMSNPVQQEGLTVYSSHRARRSRFASDLSVLSPSK